MFISMMFSLPALLIMNMKDNFDNCSCAFRIFGLRQFLSSIHSKLCSYPAPTLFPPLCQERPTFRSFTHFIPSSLSRKTSFSTLHSLHSLLSVKKDHPFEWSIDCTTVFLDKYTLAKSTMLAHPSHSATNIKLIHPKRQLELTASGHLFPTSQGSSQKQEPITGFLTENHLELTWSSSITCIL